jgi:hypothetical protein
MTRGVARVRNGVGADQEVVKAGSIQVNLIDPELVDPDHVI